MPELPEVHALAADLRKRLGGAVVQRLDVLSFAALKTFDPPPAALAGERIGEVTNHGKFLDLNVGDVHLVLHLARAGWIRWFDAVPPATGRPGRSTLAARLVIDGGAGVALTAAGSKKSLALW